MPGDGPEAYLERHFRPEELAEQWGYSVDTIRRLFANEPGVLKLFRQRAGRRPYSTIRIPASVACRVHEKLAVANVVKKLYNT